MPIWYYSLCVRMLLCTEAWRLLLYCFVDDFVAVGRGEAIDTIAYSAANGCRAVTAFPFQCTNAWWSFTCIYRFFYSIWAFILFYYCLYLSEVTNKVVQSINQFEQSCDTLPSHTIGVRGRRERDTYIYIYHIQKCKALNTWKNYSDAKYLFYV